MLTEITSITKFPKGDTTMDTMEKKTFVATFNCNNKTFFKYDENSDTVVEEFNKSAKPIPFDDWLSDQYK